MAKKLPDSWIACDRFKKKVSSKSLQVINSLLRERQTEDDLIKGLKLVVEFTPTKFDEDYFYSDRGHMAISYDNNHFFFNINPQYTKGTPENRTKRMVQLVNSWTGIRGDWSSQVEEIIAEQIQTIDQQRTNFYNELQEAGKHRNHWLSAPADEDFQNIVGKIISRYPTHSRIEARIETEIPLSVAVEYQTHASYPYHGDQFSNEPTDKNDARFIVQGKFNPSSFNISLKAIKKAGFKCIRQIYWKVEKEEIKTIPREKDFSKPVYEKDPKIDIWVKRSRITVDSRFRKSGDRKDGFYRTIRKQFGVYQI